MSVKLLKMKFIEVKLLKVELLKTKRSLALLMMFLSPMMVVLVNCMLFLHNEGAAVSKNGWGMYWSANFSMWGYFMMPLYVALITALLNGVEHKANGWRYMLSLPIKVHSLFLSKLMLAVIFLIGASSVLVSAVLASIVVFQLLGYQGDNMIDFLVLTQMVYACVASLSILTIQHIVSWRWENIVVPLGVGVVSTMSIVQFSSSHYWYLNPWTYTLIATNSTSVDKQLMALTYSLALTALLILVAIGWLKTREVKC